MLTTFAWPWVLNEQDLQALQRQSFLKDQVPTAFFVSVHEVDLELMRSGGPHSLLLVSVEGESKS